MKAMLVVIIIPLTWLRIANAAEDGYSFFERSIRPILVEHCYECHGGVNAKGGLSLDERDGLRIGGESGPAIVPGKPEASLLVEAIHYRSLEMPPKEKGGQLADAEIAALEEWVKMGAPDPRERNEQIAGMSMADAQSWWAFRPLETADSEASPATIDAFIDKRLAEHGLTPVAVADKRTLIRRATYDLIGLPPTPEEVDAFLADDSPDAFAKLVDRLLASPQYGVRWGRHWLDVVRYADTAGENSDRPLPHAWRYRNWVFDSFNRDLPYDEFVGLQLAGDLIRASEPRESRNEGIVATGYLAIARRFGHDIDHNLHLMYEDVIDNLGKSFLGLTTGCARCHDHKFDPITSADYYALYGIFDSTRFAFPGCEPRGQPHHLVPLLSPAEIDQRLKPWQAKVAAVEAEKQRHVEAAKTIKELLDGSVDKSSRRLAAAKVGEGVSVSMADGTSDALKGISVRKGEILQLTVLPNASHGADSTRVEWRITESAGQRRSWSVSDLVPVLTNGNPNLDKHDAVWCFYESTDGPAYLMEKHESLGGHASLKAWKLGDTPSVFVNTADQPVAVWTTLAARSFFVHPGPMRPVSVAWISPIEGQVDIEGVVTDAHPVGSDGVAFQLDHIAVPELGPALKEFGRVISKPLPDAGPKPGIPVAYAVVDASPRNARLQQRGDPERLGDEVPRRWLSVFGGQRVDENSGSGRRELSEWITQHPLMARVMVNRIWQWHFGHALVRTPNNFGSRGETPTNLELLDWLAAQFVACGYRVKPMHRLIMNSRAWRRASASPPSLIDTDPDNRLLGQFSRRRLSAEEIRDSLLFVAGQLDLEPAESHPFPDEQTWKFTQHDPFNAVYETDKRSAYLMVQRQRRHPFLALFDGADPNASTADRQITTVPTQALYFLNDPFFHERAKTLAHSLIDLPDGRARLVRLFGILFQRQPTTQEYEAAREFAEGYPADDSEKWRAYVRVMLASNEFVHVD